MKKNLICFFLLAGLLFPFSVLSQLVYHEGSSFPVYGKSRESTFGRYTRLPGSVADFARRPVWDLGLHSAGLAVRFRSNSTTISVRWTNTFCNSMNHMAPTGVRGLDLYAWVDGGWRFVNCARPGSGKTTESRIVSDMVPEEREYMLYLPLYDGIDSLSIGVDSCAMIGAPRLSYPVREHPIVFYGTSILQGGCSSRPGMAHTNILSRRLNCEAINLGFSGNGQLDYEIAHLMAEVDAGVFVLDFVPNVTVEQIETKLLPFYRILRDRHPDTPIVFVEDPVFPHTFFDVQAAASVRRLNAALAEHYRRLRESGERNIYYVSSEDMLGDDGEATVDGIHFTDLGMMRYADLLYPVLRRVLK